MKRSLLGVLTALLILGSVPVVAQVSPAQIQAFWQQIRSGQLKFGPTFGLLTSAYINWGNTLGTNGYGIRDNAGTIQFKNSGGAWATIAGGVTGGTCTNQVVTAIAAVTAAPTCTTVTSAFVDSSIAQVAAANLFTEAQTITKLALGTTSTDGWILQNTTAATVGTTVQISPRSRFRGNGWDTDDAVSRTIDLWWENQPKNGNTVLGALQLGFSRAGATTTYPMVVTDQSAAAIDPTNTPTGTVYAGNFVSTSTSGTDGILLGGTGSGSWIELNSNRFLFVGQDNTTYRRVLLASVTAVATGDYEWTGRSQIASPSDGTITIWNAANTNFTALQFGGTTSSFPAWKRSTTTLQARLADDSAYATIDALNYTASGAAGVTGTCDTPTFTGGVATTCGGSGGSVDGTYFVTGNFTTANNTNFQLITGLAWTFPATTAINVPFRCSLVYSQATAAVSDSLGIQDITVAPTNGMFTGSAETALGTTAYGDLTAFSSTTATAVVTFTPSATATTFNAYIDGMIEQPSNVASSAFQIQIKTTTGADAITVYRGSYCKVG